MRNLIHNATPMLLCTGSETHAVDLPRVETDGATGRVECSECGAAMVLVDYVIVDRHPTWSSLSGEHRRTMRRYYS